MKAPDIAALRAMSDNKLHEVMGHKQQLADMRSQLDMADKLQGQPRADVEAELQRQLTPSVHPTSLKYAVEDAKRKGRSGKEEAKDSSPASVLD